MNQAAIGLYGVSSARDDHLAFVSAVAEWFQSFGRYSVLAMSSRTRARKPVLARHQAVADLMLSLAREDNVELYLVDDETADVRNCLLAARYQRSSSYGRYACLVARADVLPLRELTRASVFRETLIASARPEYGIALTHSRARGLFSYLLGQSVVGVGEDQRATWEERLRVTAWTQAMLEGVYRAGLHRDVYPFNILSPSHLNRLVEGQRLEDWIRADSARGSLITLTESCKMWEVTESGLITVREALAGAKLYFDSANN